MVRNTRANGKKTRCTEKVFSSGLTGECTKAPTLKAKNTASESTVGQTEENMKVIFRRVNSMGKVFIRRQTKINSLLFGIMAKKEKYLTPLKLTTNLMIAT